MLLDDCMTKLKTVSMKLLDVQLQSSELSFKALILLSAHKIVPEILSWILLLLLSLFCFVDMKCLYQF